MKKIINKISKSSLVTIDLIDYVPKEKIMIFDVGFFLYKNTILKEKPFRSDLKSYDFTKYEGKIVAISCPANAIIPMWAYMLITSYLNNFASSVYFGSKETVFQKSVLKNISQINPSDFKNKKVLIKGCGNIKFNEQCYISITKKIKPHVASLMFGEACSSVPVFKKKS